MLTDLSVDNIYVPPADQAASSSAAAEEDRGGRNGNDSRSGSPSRQRHQHNHHFRSESAPLHRSGSGSGRRGRSPPLSDRDERRASAAIVSSVVTNESSPVTSLLGRPLPSSASAETVSAWLSANRYSSSIARELRDFSARDLLRLSREDLVAICGLASGIRLFNDLHLTVVAPSATFYVAPRGSREYSALFLEERSVSELVARLAGAVGARPELFARVFMVGPLPDMLIRVTDDVVQYTKPDTAFQFSFRRQLQQDQGAQPGSSLSSHLEACDVILETVVMSPVNSSQESLHQLHQPQPTHLDNGDSVESLPNNNHNHVIGGHQGDDLDGKQNA